MAGSLCGRLATPGAAKGFVYGVGGVAQRLCNVPSLSGGNDPAGNCIPVGNYRGYDVPFVRSEFWKHVITRDGTYIMHVYVPFTIMGCPKHLCFLKKRGLKGPCLRDVFGSGNPCVGVASVNGCKSLSFSSELQFGASLHMELVPRTCLNCGVFIHVYV